jgi:hypothetical protein
VSLDPVQNDNIQKSSIKRDHPVFFSPSPVKVEGDERTIIAIVAPHQGETSRPADILHFPELGPWCRPSTVTLVW